MDAQSEGAVTQRDINERLILSALSTFHDDVLAHRRGRPCPAAAAPALLPVPALHHAPAGASA